MSAIDSLVGGKNQAQPSASKTSGKSGAIDALLSKPKQAPIAQTKPTSLLDKITSGSEKVTDFLGLKGTTDTLGSHIARSAFFDPRLKQYIDKPTLEQDLGAALQLGSFVIPAAGAERIAASVGEGALAKAALGGAGAGLQFGALGGAGQAMTQNGNLGDIAKETATQGAIGAVGGGVLGLGGVLAGKAISKLIEKAKPSEIPKKIPVLSSSEETKIPIQTSKTKQAEYAKSQGYEPIVPDEQLPTIQMGPKEKSSLPTIQTQVPIAKGDITYEPIKAKPVRPVTLQSSESGVPVKSTPMTKTSVPRISGLKDIKGPNVNTAKAATDINRRLVAQGIDELPQHELSNFTSITKAEQTDKVAKIITTDAEKAQRMAIGQEKIPTDVHPQVLFNAVKNKAIQEGDGETLRALASSPLAKQRSLAAQALGASGFDNGPVDVVKAISDINKARENRISRTYKDTNVLRKNTVNQAKTELRKTIPTKQTVADFIQSLTC